MSHSFCHYNATLIIVVIFSTIELLVWPRRDIQSRDDDITGEISTCQCHRVSTYQQERRTHETSFFR